MNKLPVFDVEGVLFTQADAAIFLRQAKNLTKLMQKRGATQLAEFGWLFENDPIFRIELLGKKVIGCRDWIKSAAPFEGGVDSILDIGCGLGLLDLLLTRHLNEMPNLYLFDKSVPLDEKAPIPVDSGGFREYGYPFSAHLETSKEFLIRNGYPEAQIHLCEADKFSLLSIERVSLVLSMRSWGFHYPLSTYMSDVLTILDGRLIIDVRKPAHIPGALLLKDEGKSQLLSLTKSLLV